MAHRAEITYEVVEIVFVLSDYPLKKQEKNLSDRTCYGLCICFSMGGIRERQKPQAPVRNRQTSKVANAKVRIG